ncbi:MAG: glycosyltransferase, partial [Actinomycetota bacterium]
TYKNFEIIVVNDSSTDNTSLVAKEYDAEVLNLQSVPDSWLGKNWACWNGALKAKHSYLLFLDSDTVLNKNALKTIILKYLSDPSAISVQPYHYMEKPYEQLSAFFNAVLIGAMNSFSIFSKIFKPIGLFGPCIFCSTKDYFKCGGHEKVRDKVLEDLAMGQNFLKSGVKINNFIGKGIISFRMYPGGLKNLIHGWSKSFGFGAKTSSTVVLILMSLWIMGFFTALINLVRNIAEGSIFYIILSVILYLLFVSLFFAVLFKLGNFNFLISLLYIFPAVFFCIVFVYSVAISFLFKKVVWKSRVINLKKK